MIWRVALSAALALVVVLIAYWRLADGKGSGAGAALADVALPTLSMTASEGEVLFDENCASCHGKNAAGRDGFGPPLVHVIYEPNHHSDGAFHLAAKNGVRAHHWKFGDMAPVEGISEADMIKVIAYVRELQAANGIN